MRRPRVVHDIEMNTRRALCDEVDDLIDGVVEPDLFHDGRAVGIHLDHVAEFEGHGAAAHLLDALDVLHLQKRHDARDDGHGDADLLRLVDKAVIIRIVVKELGDEELRAAVLLAFEGGKYLQYSAS